MKDLVNKVKTAWKNATKTEKVVVVVSAVATVVLVFVVLC